MTLRKTILFIASQQLDVKAALALALMGLGAAFSSFALTREHFVSSVVTMLVALLCSGFAARESLRYTKKLKEREQDKERRVTADRRKQEDHATVASR